MRLLHTTEFTFKEFVEHDVPSYAILSHTWGYGPGKEEISYQQMLSGNYSAESYGWRKISRCCHLAQSRELEWVWIDTCCLDKTSSAELTETINSMFSWYQQSDECYVFLDDVEAEERIEGIARIPYEVNPKNFCNSRWFRRGWCLQELLAPNSLIFFDKLGRLLGSRTQLIELVSHGSGIDQRYLNGKESIWKASVARRMSWASGRQTTRTEDMAYSLLGIFDVNMPLLYGEGNKAFQRLQEQILRQFDDDSIFAWGMGRSDIELTSFLADSPEAFTGSKDVEVYSAPSIQYKSPSYITSKGIAYFRRVALVVNEVFHVQTLALSCRIATGALSHQFITLVMRFAEDEGKFYRVGIMTNEEVGTWAFTINRVVSDVMSHEELIHLSTSAGGRYLDDTRQRRVKKAERFTAPQISRMIWVFFHVGFGIMLLVLVTILGIIYDFNNALLAVGLVSLGKDISWQPISRLISGIAIAFGVFIAVWKTVINDEGG